MTIARFSLQSTLSYMSLGLGVAFAFFLAAWIHLPSALDFTSIGGRWDALDILGLVLSPFIVLMQVLIAWQLIFNGRRAAWIAGGELHFMNIYASVFF